MLSPISQMKPPDLKLPYSIGQDREDRTDTMSLAFKMRSQGRQSAGQSVRTLGRMGRLLPQVQLGLLSRENRPRAWVRTGKGIGLQPVSLCPICMVFFLGPRII